MRRAVGAACVIVALSATPVLAQEVKLLQKYNDWAAYTSEGSPKVCFAVSQPRDSSPKNVRRGPIYFYVSHYPGDKIAGEISVKMGYPFAPGAKVTVTIGSDKFELFTKDEGGFVEKTEDEAKLVGALKAGSSMTVQGRSARGTSTSDNYSLSGTTDALDRIAKECSG
ncbi:MAG: invasion associated locus B family protein [Methyloceanibacter sp.]|uniref:invasion associated locus B family protein n=1 Tax=Methyloceanibacter sp. TaxID=1965321 RepID=UPI003EE4161B